MIERYTRPEMAKVWSDDTKFETWLKVELAVLGALAHFKYIPRNIPAIVKRRARFRIARVKKIEDKVQHDVIAFLTAVSENVGPLSRYLHFGMTSSDMLDTALAIQIRKASDILIADLDNLLKALAKQARRHKFTIMVGRSHGVHAEPTTFGLKMALFYAEFKRNLERLRRTTENVSYGKVSGAVGTFAHLDPKVEVYVCKKLGLKPAPISTQIIQRDRHAEYLATLAIIGSSLEKLATEIRGLQRTEILEAEEPFGKGQKGSSAMPHKKNPIICERICGLARILRSNAMTGLENVTLWHERDISHSSAERVVFPDSTILLDYMLDKMAKVIENLAVYPKTMRLNLEKSKGMVFSQMCLLKLVGKGLTREEAYELVQASSRKTWNEGVPLKNALLSDRSVRKYLSEKEINGIFDYKRHLRNVGKIFKRLGL